MLQALRVRNFSSCLMPVASLPTPTLTALCVADAEIDAAEDSDDAKVAMMDLIVTKTVAVKAIDAGQRTPPPDQQQLQRQALTAELAQLRPSALRRRAVEVGVTEAELEDVEDTSEDPRATLVSLAVLRTLSGPPPSVSRPDAVLREKQSVVVAPPSSSSIIEVLSHALEHAIALCEGRTVGTPRKEKYAVADELEAALNLLEAAADKLVSSKVRALGGAVILPAAPLSL